jgi:Lipocalin-like domain
MRNMQMPGRNTMNRRSIFSLSAITALGLALLPTGASSQQKTLKEQLVGTWTLVSNNNVAPDGTKRQLFGPNPKGILILAADGHYAQVQVNPARPKFKGSTRLDGTPEENKAVVAGTVAGFGTWSVNEADKTLTVKSEGNIFPNDEGRESKRPVTLAGDELKYINPTAGSGGTTESVYKRAK